MPEVAERSTVEVLKAARERVSDPERWTTKVYARDVDGKVIGPDREAATCWCLIGAVCAEQGISADKGDSWGNPVIELLATTGHRLELPTPATLNDRLGHGGVLNFLDAAIQLAEQEAIK